MHAADTQMFSLDTVEISNMESSWAIVLSGPLGQILDLEDLKGLSHDTQI